MNSTKTSHNKQENGLGLEWNESKSPDDEVRSSDVAPAKPRKYFPKREPVFDPSRVAPRACPRTATNHLPAKCSLHYTKDVLHENKILMKHLKSGSFYSVEMIII